MPIRVMVPPKIAAKLIGIRYRDGERPVRRAQATTPGMTIATMGVLFRKADAAAVGATNRASETRSLGSPRRGELRRETRAARPSSTRVRPAAPATT